MRRPVRLAGRAPLPDGGWLTWTVADGQRGRRWRTVMELNDRFVASALLEVDPEGRFAKLELAIPGGLLTLHPERGAELHGNAVGPDGVRHLTFPWSPDHALEIEGLAVATAITAARLAAIVAVGEGRTLRSVSVARDLDVIEGEHRFVRLDEHAWRIEGGAAATDVVLDHRGLPDWGTGALEWPLEVHPHV